MNCTTLALVTTSPFLGGYLSRSLVVGLSRNPIVICCKFGRSVCLKDRFQPVHGSFPALGDLSCVRSEPRIATPATSEIGINIRHICFPSQWFDVSRWPIAESMRCHGRRYARLRGHPAAGGRYPRSDNPPTQADLEVNRQEHRWVIPGPPLARNTAAPNGPSGGHC